MIPIKYLLTSDTLTIFYQGRQHLFTRSSSSYQPLRIAICAEDWEAVPELLSEAGVVKRWSRGRFSIVANSLLLDGDAVPEKFSARVLDVVASNGDPAPLLNFFERLAKNPSKRSTSQLFDFLEHIGIPLLPDGCFYAYKGVKDDYTDCYTGKISNKPGQTVQMDRGLVSDDPSTPCHRGLHVGDESYARGFGPRVVICKVDPEHVVSVPIDESCRKMRVCRYTVVGNYGDTLPSIVCDEHVTVQTSDSEPLTEDELMSMSLDDLRKYAATLNIVGASKLPGGKLALVQKISKLALG